MYHTIIIVGNLGKDPEMRYAPNGNPVTSFNVATSRAYTDSKGAKGKETNWFRVTVWGKLAETCNQYLRKGSKVLVEGRLVPDAETGGPKVYTKQDGTPGANYEVSANTVRFMNSKSDAEPEPTVQDLLDAGFVETDEIPF